MRLNKFIAQAGVCARRKADELIHLGKIQVNDITIINAYQQVTNQDKVVYQGQLLQEAPKIYILLNKPRGYITTHKDERGRKTVMELLRGQITTRIYPVGRLDRHTTGLLLLTNDGELAGKLAHPSSQIPKVYVATLNKPIHPTCLAKIRTGVMLEDGIALVDKIKITNLHHTQLTLTLHMGKNRIIRRLFAHLNYIVTHLDRILYAHLTKKNLSIGSWRILQPKQVEQLKKCCDPTT